LIVATRETRAVLARSTSLLDEKLVTLHLEWGTERVLESFGGFVIDKSTVLLNVSENLYIMKQSSTYLGSTSNVEVSQLAKLLQLGLQLVMRNVFRDILDVTAVLLWFNGCWGNLA
jgi:hypothetical protein